jgi:small-conductance mechanosensitive channel
MFTDNINELGNNIKNGSINFIPKMVVSIIIFIAFAVLANIFKRHFSKLYLDDAIVIEENNIKINISNNKSRNIAYQQISYIVYYLIYVMGIFIALINLGVQTSTILAVLGIFVVGIGLSLQATIANIWAGLYISINKLFSIGDLIEVNKIKGYVQTFSLFNTVIIEKDNRTPIVIPNTMIQTNMLTNYSVNKIYN